ESGGEGRKAVRQLAGEWYRHLTLARRKACLQGVALRIVDGIGIIGSDGLHDRLGLVGRVDYPKRKQSRFVFGVKLRFCRGGDKPGWPFLLDASWPQPCLCRFDHLVDNA